MKIKNLTSHTISILVDNLRIEVIPEDKEVWCEASIEDVGTVPGTDIPVTTTTFNVVDLPEPEEGTIYIVPRIVAEALKGTRPDVYIVNEAARNRAGEIYGYKSLAQI
jgi:hypothetical protein